MADVKKYTVLGGLLDARKKKSERARDQWGRGKLHWGKKPGRPLENGISPGKLASKGGKKTALELFRG